jgi:hypothetical protein
MQPLAAMIALCLLVPAVATAEPEAPRFELSYGVGLGLGAAHIDGGHPFATDFAVQLGARLWLDAHLGVGVRAIGELWTPWLNGPNAQGQVLYHRAGQVVPELVARTSPLRISPRVAFTGLLGGSLGPVDVTTVDSVSKHRQVDLSSSWTVAGSAFTGVELQLAFLTGFVGLRATVNGAVDAALGPEVALGVAF